MCHTAARTSPMTTTRRANLGVAKNSRIAKRYTMPASVKETMKYGPPLSPKLREQIVSATHNVAPSMYTLHSGVTITVLPRRSESLSESPSEIVPPQAPAPQATPPCVAPLPEPAATPLPGESGRQPRQYRKKGLRNLPIAQELARAIGVSPARYWCSCRRVRKA